MWTSKPNQILINFLLTLDTHAMLYVKNAEVNQAGTKFGGQPF